MLVFLVDVHHVVYLLAVWLSPFDIRHVADFKLYVMDRLWVRWN